MGQHSVPSSALATEGQRRIEERALAIFNTDRVKAAAQEIRAHFCADRNASIPDQSSLIEQSVTEHCFHACLMAASEDPREPELVWTLAHDHQWMGLTLPGSRFGQDNPDNCYRIATIDSTQRYAIRGRFPAIRACDFSICAIPGQIGENIMAKVVGFIGAEDIDVGEDGSFCISLDATPNAGRRNHLCIADAKSVLVRDTLGDWDEERPSQLEIRCVEAVSKKSFLIWLRWPIVPLPLEVRLLNIFLNIYSTAFSSEGLLTALIRHGPPAQTVAWLPKHPPWGISDWPRMRP